MPQCMACHGLALLLYQDATVQLFARHIVLTSQVSIPVHTAFVRAPHLQPWGGLGMAEGS